MAAPKRKIVIFQDGKQLLLRSDVGRHIINLQDPRTARARKYILAGGGLYELQKIAPSTRCSWFIDQTVQSDGSMFVASAVNPLFFLIRILSTAPPVFAAMATHLGDAGATGTSDTGTSSATGSRHALSLNNVLLALKGIEAAFDSVCDKRVIAPVEGEEAAAEATGSGTGSGSSSGSSAGGGAGATPAGTGADAASSSSSTVYRFSEEKALATLCAVAWRTAMVLARLAAASQAATQARNPNSGFSVRSVAAAGSAAPSSAAASSAEGGAASSSDAVSDGAADSAAEAEATTSSSSSSSSVSRSSSGAAAPASDAASASAHLGDAVTIIGDYLTDAWVAKLQGALGLLDDHIAASASATSPASAAVTRTASAASTASSASGLTSPLAAAGAAAAGASSSGSAATSPSDASSPAVSGAKRKAPTSTPVSAAAKKLASVNTKGMKSLASMFAAAPKPAAAAAASPTSS